MTNNFPEKEEIHHKRKSNINNLIEKKSSLIHKNSSRNKNFTITPMINKRRLLNIIYTCDICECTFKWKTKLTEHMYSHTNHKTYKCKICLKIFVKKKNLSNHMKMHVLPKVLYFCDYCDYQTTRNDHLKIHNIRKHTDNYNFNCEHCGKKFKLQSDYRYHLQDHNKDSCMCDICGMSYSSRGSLYNHKQIKHKTKK